MPKEVRFTISKDGVVKAEYSGFAGEDCLREAESISRMLKSLGLKITGSKIEMKAPEQIELEVSEGVPERARERARVGHED